MNISTDEHVVGVDDVDEEVTRALTLLERVSEAAHQGWLQTKRDAGIVSRKSETDEELMVPYAQLSERAKDLDRGAVRSVLKALDDAGYIVVRREVQR